jgi:hypothetical protein
VFNRGTKLTRNLSLGFQLMLVAMFSLFTSAVAAAQTSLSSSTVAFGNVVNGTQSAAQTLTFTNNSAASITVSSVTVTAGTPYSIGPSSTCLTPALGAGKSCTVLLTFSPTALGAAPASSLTIDSTAATGGTQVVTLTGTGTNPTALAFASINFGPVAVNQSSSVWNEVLYNYQTTTISITSITAAAPYQVNSTTCGAHLGAGGTCKISVSLTPTAYGAAPSGALTVTTSAPNSPLVAPLNGKGVAPTTLSFTTMNFNNILVGTTSPVKTLVFYNWQPVPTTVNSVTTALPYAITGNTCATVAAFSDCIINYTFTPTVPGAAPTGTITVSTTAPNSPLTLTMGGTGVTATTLTQPILYFGSVAVGTTSPIQSVTLTSWLTTPVSITSITAPAPYGISANTCNSTLAAGAKCVITLTLTPNASGPVPASQLTVVSNSPSSPNTVTLTGYGIGPTTVSPAAVNFGNFNVIGQTTAIRTVKLTNNQSTTLSIASVKVTAGTPYAIDPSSTCLTPTLAAGASCTVGLTLTPTTLYAQVPGSLTIVTNASNSPQVIPLSGYALPPVYLSPVSVHFGNGVVGTTSAPVQVTVFNYQTSPLNIGSAVFNGPFVLDTGVGTTCPVSGGTVSGSLAAGQSCVIGVDFKPTALGATVGGQITLLDSGANSPQQVPLYGTGVIAAAFSPASLAFGNQVLSTLSAPKTVTLTNYQAVALNFTSITAPAPYAVGPGSSGTPCVVGTPVASGASCTLDVKFAPTAAGSAPKSLTVVDDATNSPQTVSLTGTGVSAVTLPTSLAFGNVVLNQMTTKSVTLVNNQASALTFTSIAGFTGGYSLDAANTTCSTTTALAPGNSCVIAVDLTATTLGAQPAASFVVTDSAASSPQTVSLTATAIQGVLLSPASLSFSTTFVGLTSTPKPVTMTNEQATAITISSATITGADPNDFTVTTSCPITPNTLSASGHCVMNVSFAPTATGTRTATLTIVDTATGSPQTVSLTGTGNPPVVISPDTTQTFTAPVGTTSAYKTFTITNESTTVPLIFSQFKLTGDFIQSATTCPIGGLGIGGAGAVASCTVSVEFDPSIGGTRDGQFQVYDNNLPTSPQVVNLTGSGTSPLTLSLGSLSFTSQTVGTVSASKMITLTNHETESETFSISAVGSLAAADYSATTNCSSGVIAANSSCTINVRFSPTSITPSTTRGGTLSVTNSAPGGSTLTASLTGSAIATNPPAAVASVSPGAGGSGTVVPAVITGNGWTHFSASSTIAFVETTNNAIPCNIAVSGITSPNANTLDATLTLSGDIFGACDVTVTTPLSGGGTETAKLVSAFNLADPTQSHTITAVSPAFGTQGQTLNVAITAVGTHFVQGVTIGNFGDGVEMDSPLTIVDSTHAIANITISNTTYVGYRTVTMQTNGEFAVSVLTAQGNPIFQIGANNATLVSVSPNVEPQGFSGQITLTATGTHFLQNATQVSIGGVIVGDVNVTSPTTAIAEVAVPAAAPIGLQNVTVSTGGEIIGLGNAFTITGATPALLSVSPSSGQQGQSLDVVITGNSFTSFVAGNLTANLTGEIGTGTIVVNNIHQVTVPITIHSDAVVGPITATLISGTTNFPFTFTVTCSSASITSVTPTCVAQGGQVNLSVTGVNSIWAQGTTMSQFYPAGVPTPGVDEVTINSATSATLAVAVPTNSPAGTYTFYMATGGQVLNASINVCPATPTLTMSPANGVLPTAPAVNSFTVNFTGQFTHWDTTTLPVIAGEGVTLTNFKVFSPVSASGTVTIIGSTNGTPTATGARLVTFTTAGRS